MKKLFLIVLISSFSLMGYSQVKVGLKGAVSMSTLTTNISDYENAFNSGFQAGVFARIGKKLHLQPEIYFSAKSGEFTYDISPSESQKLSIKETVTLNSIDVPVLVGYKIFNPPAMNVRLQAGPVASFVLNKDFDVTLNGVSEDPSDTYKDAWSNMSWALQFGAGVDVLFMTLDVRYELGLSSVYNQPENSPSDHNSVKSNMFIVSLGLKIFKI